MTSRTRTAILMVAAILLPMLALSASLSHGQDDKPRSARGASHLGGAITVGYLEIVTPNVDMTCQVLTDVHGVRFDGPIAELGNARTAKLDGGGRIGVRAPMRSDEAPVVRPYVAVDDIEAAIELARVRGAEIALPPTLIPGQGTCAIYILAGIQHGLWQE